MLRANSPVVLRKTGTNATSGRLTVPGELMQHLREGQHFIVEVNDEGILFRPVGEEHIETPELPDWAQQPS